MQKLFKSTFQKVENQISQRTGDRQAPLAVSTREPSTLDSPTVDDLLRYRYHHGANIGSVFVLERWLNGSMFLPEAQGGSEFDAVSAYQRQHGLEQTRGKWEEHWRNAITDQQLEWLAVEAKCTSIRLPIGYFTLGPQWCNGTPFAEVAGVYENAWEAVKNLTRRAREWGIGTLIDFHAVQGGANREEHSGTTSGKAELWDNQHYRGSAKSALVYIAEQVRSGALQGIVGIQIVNEATHHSPGMYEWYDEVIREIGQVDQSIPIYISDAWNLETCLQWVTARSTFAVSPRNPIIIDTHKYYTFSDEDRNQSPQQIISRIQHEFGELERTASGLLSNRGEAQVIVGEWSCVLDGQTWSRVPEDQKEGLVREFGQAQCRAWNEKTGGSYFWTYKMEWMPGGEWGFEEQTRKGNISAPNSLFLPSQEVLNRVQAAHGQRGQLATTDRSNHENYWNSTQPGKRFEHHLYSQGWEVGYLDALNLFKMRAEGHVGERARNLVGGGDKIGCLEVWTKKRLLQSGVRGEFAWEWEQGFRRGVQAFYAVVGV